MTVAVADTQVVTLVLHLRPSRRKAREVACAELVALLRDLGAREAKGGPLSEVSGVAWVEVPAPRAQEVAGRVKRLGYIGEVEIVRPLNEADPDPDPTVRSVRWRRRDVSLLPIYEEGDSTLRQYAPDARSFLLECGDGVVRRISGYRGGRGPLEHRALPVVDARMLVNLVSAPKKGRLLDPFSGAGGILIEANASGWQTLSMDLDPALRFGLGEIAHEHLVGEASHLPFGSGSIDAIATEPPYHPTALRSVLGAIPEMARVLREGARASMLVSSAQASDVAEAAEKAGLVIKLMTPIDRKGTDVTVLCLLR